MLELHVRFADGSCRCFPEHKGFVRAALVGLYLRLRGRAGSALASRRDHTYYNLPNGAVFLIPLAQVVSARLTLDGEDIGDRVSRGEFL